MIHYSKGPLLLLRVVCCCETMPYNMQAAARIIGYNVVVLNLGRDSERSLRIRTDGVLEPRTPLQTSWVGGTDRLLVLKKLFHQAKRTPGRSILSIILVLVPLQTVTCGRERSHEQRRRASCSCTPRTCSSTKRPSRCQVSRLGFDETSSAKGGYAMMYTYISSTQK